MHGQSFGGLSTKRWTNEKSPKLAARRSRRRIRYIHLDDAELDVQIEKPEPNETNWLTIARVKRDEKPRAMSPGLCYFCPRTIRQHAKRIGCDARQQEMAFASFEM